MVDDVLHQWRKVAGGNCAVAVGYDSAAVEHLPIVGILDDFNVALGVDNVLGTAYARKCNQEQQKRCSPE